MKQRLKIGMIYFCKQQIIILLIRISAKSIMTRKIILVGLYICTAITISSQNTNSKIEKRIDSILRQMTIEEKIGQMNQLHIENTQRVKSEIRKGHVGSVMSVVDPIIINELQRIAVEESRLHIPLLIARDVIHGYKTIFPIPLGQAASFNPQIVEEGARVTATEASAAGIRWTFAPMIDITHDPRWGRIAESFGEDPLLVSTMGVAMIRGFQGESLANPTSIAACAKHFAGYGATEGGRDYNSTFIPERLYRNLYLRPFEKAVETGVATLMTSFNDNDGVPSSGNTFLLKEILRNEWKFDGFVVSDWASISEMVKHGFCSDEKEAAMKAANAGLDMEMVSETYMNYLPQLIAEKKIKLKAIDDAVRNILRLKFRMGLFENPYCKDLREKVFYNQQHLETAKKAAIQSIVLLKNENRTLPIGNHVKTILIVGPLADAPHEQLGTWVFDAEDSHSQTPLNAIKQLCGDKVQIIYKPVLRFSRDSSSIQIQEAIQLASQADIILAFVGEEAILSGEAHCLTNLNLQGAQSALIDAMAQTGKPLITVIMAGRPLTIEHEINKSNALLYAWHPGTMGGPAIADLLFGNEIPSGKLPVTFPKSVGQIPLYYNHNNTGRPANGNELQINQIPVGADQTSLGNTSFYLDMGEKPLFPFGFGLSYTTFKYSNLQLSTHDIKSNDSLFVSFDLENSGKFDAIEVAQLYVQDVAASVTRPVKELIQFQRINLKAAEKKHLIFKVTANALSFWNIDMKKVVEPGKFNLWIGGSSIGCLKTDFTYTL